MNNTNRKLKSINPVDGKVSKFQQFLWWVAGAEKSILIECRTDYQKYFAIGAIILMTTIFAFIAGGAAAWFFTQSSENTKGSLIASFLFGMLWALLIFSIDRSLVVTLKRNPKLKSHQQFIRFVFPVLMRFLLASLIAILISIPLELVIFEGFIKQKEDAFLLNEKKNLSAKFEDLKKIPKEEVLLTQLSEFDKKFTEKDSALNNNIEKLESSIKSLEKQINNPNTKKYNSAMTRYNELKKEINKLEKERENSSDKTKIDKDIKQNREDQDKQSSIFSKELEAWNSNIYKQIKSINNDCKNERVKKEKNDSLKYNNDNNLNKQSTYLVSIKQINGSLQKRQDSLSKITNKFIYNYRILHYAVNEKALLLDKKTNIYQSGDLANKTELMFFWLIRLLFLIIEISPTIVKVFMPIGVYDWRIYKEEKDIELTLTDPEYELSVKALATSKAESKKESLNKQMAAEKELRAELISKMSEIQKEVTEAYLKDWRDNELQKIKERHDFIQYS